MKKLMLSAVLTVLSLAVFAALQLSPQSKVSLITYGASAELHGMYGHSAIRVTDELQGVDVVFNYGIFSFSKPNFVYRFAKGQTDYLLAMFDFKRTAQEYIKDGRSIYEQDLNLSPKEKQQLFDALVVNALPKNREYRYNFFEDNCATRVRDIVEKNVDGKVKWADPEEIRQTYRGWINHYQQVMPWANFGIDLVVGAPADRKINRYEEMFLPDWVKDQFGKGKIVKGNRSKPLVTEGRWIFQPEETLSYNNHISIVTWFFLLLFLATVLLTMKEQKKQKHYFWLDGIWYLVFGLVGVVLTWFALVSEHPAMHPNYNLAWALPTHLIYAIGLVKTSWRNKLSWYPKFTAIAIVLFGISIFTVPQQFASPVIWMVGSLAIRVGVGLRK
jgi:hypothetical protein